MARNIVVTFDIDGTIMDQNNNGDHRSAMRYALKNMFGIDQTPHQFLSIALTGCTDKWIASECIKKALHKEEAPLELIDQFYELCGKHFVEIHKESGKLCPGIVKVLEKLNEMEGVHVGLVTGNIPAVGWKKLQLMRIDQYFDKNLGGLGTHVKRSDIILGVKKTAEELWGPVTRLVHVGDAMQDVDAAIEAGVIAAAVDTGNQKDKIFKQPSFYFKDLNTDFDEFISVVETGKTKDGHDHINQKFQ